MKNKLMIAAAVIAAVGFAASVQALPIINGNISFGGGIATVNTGDLGTATAFSTITGNLISGGAETGSYAALNGGGQGVTFSTFGFGGNVLSPNPTALWTVTYLGITYSFSATSVIIVGQTSSPQFLNLTGSGIASITGYQDTAGTWTITDTGNTPTFTFSASTTVPDGGMTVGLMGLALGACGLFARKIKRA